MLCDICGKNQATVHLTEIIDEQMNELHLCEECARQKSAQMESQFGLSDLLAGMAEFGKPDGKQIEEAAAAKCPNCGLSYVDFKKIGRLGCGECYGVFKRYLAPLLKRIHGSLQHTGKSAPKPAAAAAAAIAAARPVVRKRLDPLQELRAKLNRAVESEAFEEAAKLRDQIKALEKKGKAAENES